jgi:hypothetical protein
MVIYMKLKTKRTKTINLINNYLFINNNKTHLIEILLIKNKNKLELEAKVYNINFNMGLQSTAVDKAIKLFFYNTAYNSNNIDIIQAFINSRLKAELVQFNEANDIELKHNLIELEASLENNIYNYITN